MTKHPLIAVCSLALLAGCAEGAEPDESSEEAVVKRPDRNVTFGTPIEQDSLETDNTEPRLRATDLARSGSRVINVKPVLEFPQPPSEHETSPIAPGAKR